MNRTAKFLLVTDAGVGIEDNGKVPDYADLPFVSVVNRMTAEERWNHWDAAKLAPLSSLDWELACLIGQYFAVKALEFARLTGDSDFIGHVMRDMPRANERCGLAVGFTYEIGRQLMREAA